MAEHTIRHIRSELYYCPNVERPPREKAERLENTLCDEALTVL